MAAILMHLYVLIPLCVVGYFIFALAVTLLIHRRVR